MHLHFKERTRFNICIIWVMLVFFLNSCRVERPASMLQMTIRDTLLEKYITPSGEMRIQKNDVLGITVSSLNKELDVKFNTLITPSTGNTGSIVQDPGYPVDLGGNIQLHYLGSVKAEGYTRKEFAKSLEEKLSPYLKEPIVQVKFLNKKVTIMGAVEKPQIIFLPEESISLLDALVICGDMTKNAKADEVYIFRDTADVRQVKKINLSDVAFMKTSWSILKPNDIVYVKKDFTQEFKDDDQRRMQMNISIITSLTSIIVLLVTVFRK